MPCLDISTNVSLDGVDTDSIFSEVTKAVASTIGKPEAYVMVVLKGSVEISFGGNKEPAAFAEIVSMGGINSEVKKNLILTIGREIDPERIKRAKIYRPGVEYLGFSKGKQVADYNITKTMPILNLSTNVNLDGVVTSDVANYVMILLKGSIPISYGGTDQPAAYGELVSIGCLNPDVNKQLTAAISTVLETRLSVPRSRFFLKFYKSKGSYLGYNGSTLDGF